MKRNYDELNSRELTRGETNELCWALKELSEALTERSAWGTLRHTDAALRYINEFIGNLVPLTNLTEKDADFCRSMHTYMRKGMDGPLSVILYRLISDSKGTPIWYAFAKEAVNSLEKGMKYQYAYRNAIAAAENERDNGRNSTDDILMLESLRLWEDDFVQAVGWIKGE